ncbi:LLM class flavin-dependent oxidoreductase [Asticcacaulis sp. 201]|uniref:LLM class flavin-dependent oxidoreductase n=1 Tax=Asticcacaulis sp. 201 TaxID=3028787 RepID=UPI002915F689|nr:LLM class flavin-dependent oxidoreductase [Asticcacaulis sp. 201]MDV6330772.1 LLM class flavin-dependent oxidoreductase [Asticcacaulis sp. 201]
MSLSSGRAGNPLKFGYVFSPRDVSNAFDPDQLTAQAQLAEAGVFDFIRFQERALSGVNSDARTEPFTTASFLATRTRRIGLIAQASTSYYEPFNLARLIASLDHVTHGRAGWELVTGAERPAHSHFSQAQRSAEAHYARAEEVVEILRKLWDSWEAGAFVRNKTTGEYVDGAKIHAIHHNGDLFRIKGPLNVARSPQGHAVVALTARDDISTDLAVREADLIFLDARPAVDLRSQADQIRTRLNSAGRTARVFADLAPGDGEPGIIADRIEALAETVKLDGINLHFGAPGALAAYVGGVVPELQARGLLARDYTGVTLRDHLGFAEPANRYAA